MIARRACGRGVSAGKGQISQPGGEEKNSGSVLRRNLKFDSNKKLYGGIRRKGVKSHDENRASESTRLGEGTRSLRVFALLESGEIVWVQLAKGGGSGKTKVEGRVLQILRNAKKRRDGRYLSS